MTHSKITPTHPGIVLQKEFLEPYGLTAAKIARETGIPASRLCEIFAGRRGITADTAIRLGKLLGLNPQGFVNMQATYDRVMAEIAIEHARPPLRIKPLKLQLARAWGA